MNGRHNSFFDARVIISLSIIAAGAILLADNLGLGLNINLWEWWPVVLILVGISQLARPAAQRQVIAGVGAIFFGAVFLGNNLDLFYFNIGDLWPLILILVGISMIRNHSRKQNQVPLDHDSVNLNMILGGGEHRFASKKFKGGKVTAILGGGDLDLTEAEMEGDFVEIDAFVMMGGLEIRIPKHWQVVVQATPIMGGVENKTYNSYDHREGLDAPQTGKRLILQGTIMMGALEVKN